MSVASPIVNGNGSVTELSLAELRDIAARQQARIDAQLNDLRHRQLALTRLRKDGSNGLANGGALAAAIEDRDVRLSRLRVQRRQLDEYRQANAQLTAQLAQAREAFQRRSDELTVLDQRVEAMRKLAESRQQNRQHISHWQQQQQQSQSKSQSQLHPTLPSPDSRLARLRETVLQRRQQSEQLRLKAVAAAAAAAAPFPTAFVRTEVPDVAERPPSPPTQQWHRRHAPRHVIIASACRRGGQLPADAAAATTQRYREAARLAYEAAAAKEQHEKQQQQQQQQAVSLTPDSIEDLIRLEASAKPEEKRRSLVVVQDPPGAPIGWRAPIARPDEDEVTYSNSSSGLDGSSIVAEVTATATATTTTTTNAIADEIKPDVSSSNFNLQPDEESNKTTTSSTSSNNSETRNQDDGVPILPAINRKKNNVGKKLDRSVTFAPLTVLLDAALEGDPNQIRACVEVSASPAADVSACNEEGITALHNAVCAGHADCVRLLISLGANVNAADVDGWTPLHCSVSCNHLALTRLLVKSGAAIYCATRADFETPLDLCQEGGAVERFLRDEAEKLGNVNGGRVFATMDFEPERPDELPLTRASQLVVVRRADQDEPDWFWCRGDGDAEGYAPRSLLSLYPPGGTGVADDDEAGEASSSAD